MKYRPIAPYMFLRFVVRSVSTGGLRQAVADSCAYPIHLVRRHGLIGFVKLLFRTAPAASAPVAQQQTHPFDLRHGTDTSGHMSGAYFPAISLSSIFTTGYCATTPSAFMQALRAVPIRFEDFTFVDIGCGKGRALLLAAEFPFRNLVGVELGPELCEIARANIATAPGLAGRVSILNEDATTLAYPDGPLLLFLFNPFLAPVQRRVLRNLEQQLRHSPRPAYLLYELAPHYPQVLSAFPSLKQISEITYAYSPEDAAADPMGRTEERYTLYSFEIPRCARAGLLPQIDSSNSPPGL